MPTDSVKELKAFVMPDGTDLVFVVLSVWIHFKPVWLMHNKLENTPLYVEPVRCEYDGI